jgi:hypothetical protein
MTYVLLPLLDTPGKPHSYNPRVQKRTFVGRGLWEYHDDSRTPSRPPILMTAGTGGNRMMRVTLNYGHAIEQPPLRLSVPPLLLAQVQADNQIRKWGPKLFLCYASFCQQGDQQQPPLGTFFPRLAVPHDHQGGFVLVMCTALKTATKAYSRALHRCRFRD